MNIFDFIKTNLDQHIDNYQIATNILTDYKYFNYKTFEGALNHVLFVFSTYYKFELDETILNQMLKNEERSMNRRDEYHFRNAVIGKYQKCIISGYDSEQCDVAHIVPLSDHYNFDPDNGLLLSKELHYLFDIGYWTIDVNTLKVILLEPSIGKNLSINQYKNVQIDPSLFTSRTIDYLRKHNQQLKNFE